MKLAITVGIALAAATAATAAPLTLKEQGSFFVGGQKQSLDTAGCSVTLKPAQLATLARIPILIVYGDNLEGVAQFAAFWKESFERCNKFVEQVNAAGGKAKMMSLPAMGICSNSHMLMMDKNNQQVADLIIGWMDENVEGRKPRRPGSK